MQSKQEKLIEQLNTIRCHDDAHQHDLQRATHAGVRSFLFTHLNSLFYIHSRRLHEHSLPCWHLGVTKAAVSQMIDRLVDSGLISRQKRHGPGAVS
jgi:DNA-binding MarR family transcriptional regulator